MKGFLRATSHVQIRQYTKSRCQVRPIHALPSGRATISASPMPTNPARRSRARSRDILIDHRQVWRPHSTSSDSPSASDLPGRKALKSPHREERPTVAFPPQASVGQMGALLASRSPPPPRAECALGSQQPRELHACHVTARVNRI